MKMTIFIGGLSGGGAERVVCNLASYLCTNGHAVDIVTMSDDVPTYTLHPLVKRHALLQRHERKTFLGNCLLRWKHLKQYIQTSDTQCYLAVLPITSIFLLLLHRHIQVPILVAERADPASQKRHIWFMLRYLLKYASGFIFQTKDAQDYYAPFIKGKPSIVIPNAINPDFIRPISFTDRKKQIVAIGRFRSQKNFMLLLRAFSAIHADYPQYTLTIYGQGEQRAPMETFIKQNNLENVVSLPGYVQNIAQQLSTAQIFVLSSNFEGMPNALMEAMASGLACISTDCPCGGPRFLIQNEKNGLLVPVGDQRALEDVLRRVLADAHLREELGREAVHIQQKLAPQTIYKQWKEFVQSVICRGNYAN